MRRLIPLLLVLIAGPAGTAGAANDAVTLTFTTVSAGGKYSPRNVHAVYLTDAADRFVTTVGGGTGAQRALWGNARAHDLLQWFTANPNAQADIDARTGATQTAYKTYTLSWDWTRRDGSVVPDGAYRLKFEMTDDNADKNKFNRAEFAVTKGRSPWKIGPVTQGGYKDVVIEHTPAVAPQIVCDPNLIDFGASAVGLAQDRTFTLRNPATAAVIVTSVKITGQDQAAYALIAPPAPPFALAPGDGSVFTVRFAPQAAGSYTDAKVEVTATGVAAISPVLLRGKADVLPGAIETSTDRVVFAQTSPGGSATAAVSIANPGAGPLHVLSMTFTGLDADCFALVEGDGALPVLLPGQSPVLIAIRFTPLTYKICLATLAIASDDPNHPVAYVALEGDGGPLQAETLPVWYGLGSQCRAIAMAGTQAVIGQGAVLSVYFVADRCGPFFVSSTVLPGSIEGLTIVGDTGYAALGESGFAVVHVEEVNAPTVLSTVETPGFCRGVARVGDRLCVADAQGGLRVYDASAPGTPRRVGTVAGDIVSVAGLTRVAVCLDSQAGLLVVDANGAAVLGQDSRLKLGRAVAASGSFAYVVDGIGRFFAMDLADPASPRVVGETRLVPGAEALVVTGTTVAAAGGAAGLQRVDVSDPTQPRACTQIPLAGGRADLAANSLGIYVVDSQLGLYDFHLPNGCEIVQRRTFSLGMVPVDLASDGRAAYVAGGSFGLFVWDMREPMPPRFLGHVEGDVQGVCVSGQTAYLACGSLGLKVLDVSSATAPRDLGVLDVGGPARTVACDGVLALIGTDASVTSVDVSDPCHPLVRSTWQAEGPVLDLCMAQGQGYVACGARGLVVLDRDGSVAGVLDTPGVAYKVALSQGIAYVADGPVGVQVIDVHDSRVPTLVATIPTPSATLAVAVDGNDLYAAGRYGVWRLDVAATAAPVIRAVWSLPGNCVSLAPCPSAVLAADPRSGVIVLGR